MSPDESIPPASARRPSLPSTNGPSAAFSASLSAENLAAAQQGCRLAQGLLAEAIRPIIERQLVRYPLSEEDRLDVLQSTQMQVLRRLSSFRGQSSFTTWLFRVTANEALMLMRSQRRRRARITTEVDLEEKGLTEDLSSDAARADSTMLENERDGSVRTAVAMLPEHYQEVVAAHYVDELGLHEIADRLKLSESAVRSRLHRARARLRDLLASENEGELSLSTAPPLATRRIGDSLERVGFAPQVSAA
jgi:RNA polymerase sigma-70 factor, ECF subfamily